MADSNDTSDSSIDPAVNQVKQAIEDDESLSVEEDFDEEDIRASMGELEEYAVPVSEMAESYINNNFKSESRPDIAYGSSRSGESDELVEISDQGALEAAVAAQEDTSGAFIASVFTVVDDLPTVADSMRRRLLAATPDGRMAIAIWEGCNANFNVGETYHVTGLKVEYHEPSDQFLLGMNENTSVTADPDASTLTEQYEQDVPVDFEPPDSDKEFEGYIVEIREDGLIKRCQEEVENHEGDTVACDRVLREGECRDHGSEVDSEFDLRLKARVELTDLSTTIYADRETLEAMTEGEVTFEKAQEWAEDAMDTSVVRKQLEHLFIGTKVNIEGSRLQGYGFAVEDYEYLTGGDEDRAEALSNRAETQWAALSADDEESMPVPAESQSGQSAAAD
jgi:hypothetical protein